MNLESCPPISKTVSTCGSAAAAARAWAVISSRTMSAPMSLPMSVRPDPVTPAHTTRTSPPSLLPKSARPCVTAFCGLPRVRRYCASKTRPHKSTNTRLVLVEPTSTPSAHGTRPSRSTLHGRGVRPNPSSGLGVPAGSGAKRASPLWTTDDSRASRSCSTAGIVCTSATSAAPSPP